MAVTEIFALHCKEMNEIKKIMCFVHFIDFLLTISPPGEAILMCVQSIAPMHRGKPAIAAKAAAFAKHSA